MVDAAEPFQLPDHVGYGADAMKERSGGLIEEMKRRCSNGEEVLFFCAGMVGNLYGGLCSLLGVDAARELLHQISRTGPGGEFDSSKEGG